MSNKDLAAEYFDAVWSQHYNPEKIRLLADSALLWRYPMHGEFHGPESVIAMLTSFPGVVARLDVLGNRGTPFRR
jgi:hypothetical protein